MSDWEGECEESKCKNVFRHSVFPSFPSLDAIELCVGPLTLQEKGNIFLDLRENLLVKPVILTFDARSMSLSVSVAADPDFHACADREGQARVANWADVLLAEKVVELGEDGDEAGGGEDGVEVEFGVTVVQIEIG